MNKKKLLSLSVVVIMIAILSFSSLAWFSDADSVTNNFNIAGGKNEKPEQIFSLEVKEKIDADEDGEFDDTPVGAGEDEGGHLYEDILPGDMLLKKPYAVNTGSYDQYVLFKVTIDNADDWVAVMQKYGYELHDLLYADKTTKLTQSADWTFVPQQTTVEDDKVTYVFYYNEVLEPADWVVLFNYVKIPAELNQNDMALFTEGKFQMVVTGEAVQVEHTGASAQEAFYNVENGGQAIDQIS